MYYAPCLSAYLSTLLRSAPRRFVPIRIKLVCIFFAYIAWLTDFDRQLALARVRPA